MIGREETVDEIESIVSQMIADCAEQLQQEKSRLEKLMANNGISETPTYRYPRKLSEDEDSVIDERASDKAGAQ